MTPIRITIIPIQPSTHVRSTQGDRWLFAVTDEKIQEYDNRRLLETGKRGGNQRRKMQLDKYNAYKEEIRWWARVNKFEMPRQCFAIWFYIPFPKTWLRYKKKCLQMHGAAHESTPDWDNLIKALFDALMPRKSRTRGQTGGDDRKINCGATFKVWVRPEDACIKIIEYDKTEYMEAFKHGHPFFSCEAK